MMMGGLFLFSMVGTSTASQSESLGLYISDLTCNIYLYCNTFRILRFDSISDRPKNTTFLQYYYFPMTIRISSLARFVSV
jgi:hypothetical protein